MTDVLHRLAEPADAPRLLELFERTKPVIARLAHPAVYRAIVADALARRRSLIVVSESGHDLVAFSVIVWDWHRFRADFALRHPRVTLLLAVSRIRRWRRRHRTNLAPATPSDVPEAEGATHRADHTGPRWSEGGPTIAKVLFTAVAPAMRGRGIATGLKAFYVDHLRRNGFRRVDAMSRKSNAASLAVNRASGWVATSQGDSVYAYLELNGGEPRP